MKTSLFSLTLFLGFLAHGQDQNNNLSKKDINLSVKEDTFNFGNIPQGKPVHHEFEIVNTGAVKVKLNNIQASCGCTTPEWEKDKELMPGEKSTVKVGYNAAAEGRFTKSITITYNDNLNRVIYIKGDVWKTPATSAPLNSAVNALKEL